MSFYVTLPSNSSMNMFDNSISNFTTQLHIPIKFNGPYEVALVEIAYDHNWDVDLGKIKYIYSDEITLESQVLYRDGEGFEKLISKINVEIGAKIISYEKDKIKKNHPEMSDKELHKFLIESLSEERDYHDVDNDIIVKRNRIPIVLLVDNELKVNTMNDNHHYKFEGVIADLLGLNNILLNSKTAQIKINSDYLKSFYVISSLYIYSDIIKYQYVGDTLAPLLRNVVVTPNKNYTIRNNIYDSPQYIPVNRSVIDTINIQITDEFGKNIRFTGGKSIVKLNFRPIRYGF